MSDRLLHTTLRPGDRVRLRKVHPCGSEHWEVLRLGTEVRLRCLGCQRIVAIPRSKLAGALQEKLPPEEQTPGDAAS